MRMLFAAMAAASALLSVSAASATSDVSAKFDGLYAGNMIPSPGMSAPSCPVLAARVTFSKGIIQTSPGIPAFDGLVTEEGFVTGHMLRADGSKVVFEGRLEGTVLSGGIIDDDAGCAWTVNLKKAD